MLVTFNELSITVGIFLAFVLSVLLSPHRAWRLMFLLCAVPSLLQLVSPPRSFLSLP
jgi:MFS family permease